MSDWVRRQLPPGGLREAVEGVIASGKKKGTPAVIKALADGALSGVMTAKQLESAVVARGDGETITLEDYVEDLIGEKEGKGRGKKKLSGTDDAVFLLTKEEAAAVPGEIATAAKAAGAAAATSSAESLSIALGCATTFLNLFATKADTIDYYGSLSSDMDALNKACQNFTKAVSNHSKKDDKKRKRAATAGDEITAANVSEAIVKGLDTSAGDFAQAMAKAAASTQVVDAGTVDQEQFKQISQLLEDLHNMVEKPSGGAPPPAVGDQTKTLKTIEALLIQSLLLGAGKGGRGEKRVQLRTEPTFTLPMHIRFLDMIETRLTLNDRKSRDWSALEKILKLDDTCPVKHVKQKAKRVLQERRNRNQLRFWDKLKAANEVSKVKKELSDMIGNVPWADSTFLNSLAEHVLSLVSSNKKSPGSVLEWPEKNRKILSDKLVTLHKGQFKNRPMAAIQEHFKDLLSVADVELAILSATDDAETIDAWNLRSVQRSSEPLLRAHWSREKAALLKAILTIHKDFEENQFHAECKKRIKKVKNWNKQDLDSLLRAAHPKVFAVEYEEPKTAKRAKRK